ncbi:MAG TPA: hypothetical protein VGC95_06590, partial [Chitinophagaceae bacterium]
DARQAVEPIVRSEKRADLLRKKIGNITTLEAVSNSLKQPIQTADSIRFAGGGNTPISSENKVIGAAFNPNNKGKVVPEVLQGRFGGVYVVRVDNVSSTIVENADIAGQKSNMESQARMRILMGGQFSQFGGYGQQYDPAAVLRKAASIKDYRSRFY